MKMDNSIMNKAQSDNPEILNNLHRKEIVKRKKVIAKVERSNRMEPSDKKTNDTCDSNEKTRIIGNETWSTEASNQIVEKNLRTSKLRKKEMLKTLEQPTKEVRERLTSKYLYYKVSQLLVLLLILVVAVVTFIPDSMIQVYMQYPKTTTIATPTETLKSLSKLSSVELLVSSHSSPDLSSGPAKLTTITHSTYNSNLLTDFDLPSEAIIHTQTKKNDPMMTVRHTRASEKLSRQVKNARSRKNIRGLKKDKGKKGKKSKKEKAPDYEENRDYYNYSKGPKGGTGKKGKYHKTKKMKKKKRMETFYYGYDLIPTSDPTQLPRVKPTPAPVIKPTRPPMVLPTLEDWLQNFAPLSALQNPQTPQGFAFRWLKEEDQASVSVDKTAQRFAILSLDYSAHDSSAVLFADPKEHECTWDGIICNDSGAVTKINWANKQLSGYISPELSILESLEYLDLAQNKLGGNTNVFWEVPTLKLLYLHENNFSGPLSKGLKEMTNLESLYLGYNQLTGHIPSPFIHGGNGGSNLKFLILQHNQFSGQIPTGLKFKQVYYLDLGNNALTGTLPSDWKTATNMIRILFLDNNKLRGTIPKYFPTIGNGRLKMFSANDNQLSGEIPGDWGAKHTLTNMKVQNNNFNRINPYFCRKYNVFTGGELIEFRADCEICTCKDLCHTCV